MSISVAPLGPKALDLTPTRPTAPAADTREPAPEPPAVEKSISPAANAAFASLDDTESTLPPSWTHNLGAFAGLSDNAATTRTTVPDGSGRVIVTGTRGGVDVSVVVDRDGRVVTGYAARP
ncbi:MAG: hypothetical protein ABIQ30_18560 [Devosia sp.]